MKIETRAVHTGDRKPAGAAIPVTTPIVPATSYIHADIETTDKVFADEIEGFAYARYGNPTACALEELVNDLEGGAGAVATCTGMIALQTAIQVALTDRGKRIVAASALYGATTKMLMNVFEPLGVAITFVDVSDTAAVTAAIAENRPACVVLETISNPLLRVADLPAITKAAEAVGAVAIVDNTFATPLLVRPFEYGAHMVVHSLTKYLSGHGDVMGGIVISDQANLPVLRALSRTVGPNLGAFEAYLAMRGVKTFPLRMERQCTNAAKVAAALRANRRVSRVHYLDDPAHPDKAVIDRLLAARGLYGGMVSFELRDAVARADVFAFMNRLKLVVKATSLGDIHTIMVYPAMSSHRDLSPKQRQRLGIGDNLVRLSVGIEAAEDVIADLEQALAD